MSRRQQEVIIYLQAENEILKEQLDTKGQKLKLSNHQRRKLAKQGKLLGRKRLKEYLNVKGGNTAFTQAALAHPVFSPAWKAAFTYYDPKVRLDFSDTGESSCTFSVLAKLALKLSGSDFWTIKAIELPTRALMVRRNSADHHAGRSNKKKQENDWIQPVLSEKNGHIPPVLWSCGSLRVNI